jgi:DNA-binding NtrC family response regulator
VDDEAHIRSMMGATLERHGYDVQMAASGREALETLDQNTFDLVLTDIVMQDGNGIALLDRIHAQQPQLPVVMVTAVHDISVAIDSMRRGAYDYLLKPFEREHLVNTVQRALEPSPGACRRTITTSRTLSRWCAPGPRCSARRWKIWSTPTTSRWRRWATRWI